jgi:hypothetical protein
MPAAQAFLNELDTHPVVGGLVDCISPFEVRAHHFPSSLTKR